MNNNETILYFSNTLEFCLGIMIWKQFNLSVLFLRHARGDLYHVQFKADYSLLLRQDLPVYAKHRPMNLEVFYFG